MRHDTAQILRPILRPQGGLIVGMASLFVFAGEDSALKSAPSRSSWHHSEDGASAIAALRRPR